jgi:predicted RNase H-like HicB family nuclease
MPVIVKAQFQLFGVIKKQNGWYVAYCPPLDLTTQGQTESEAKKNLIEASELFVISCFERGTFDQALRELGWSVVRGAVQMPRKRDVPNIPHGTFRFPVPVPFGLEKAMGCPA